MSKNKKKCQGREKNKCPLFLILIHWIFVIIEYNILCICNHMNIMTTIGNFLICSARSPENNPNINTNNVQTWIQPDTMIAWTWIQPDTLIVFIWIQPDTMIV